MSPNVSSFVHDLVDMARAMEQLPVVQAQLETAEASNLRLSETVSHREESILALKAEIETLHGKVREAEQGRDQAETMFLECDDKLSAFRNLAAGFSLNIASLLKAEEPAAPVAVSEPEPVQGVSEPNDPLTRQAEAYIADHGEGLIPNDPAPAPAPSAEPSPILGTATGDYAHVDPRDAGMTGGEEEGVSVGSDPIASTGHSSMTTDVPVDTFQANVSPTEPTASIDTDPEPTRYEYIENDDGTKRQQTRHAWWAWYDSQTQEFKQSYPW